MSRNARFVSAAKALLAVQVAGCVGAAGVTAWAAFEVRDMVRERDALAARVAQLEAVIPPAMLPPPLELEAPEADPADPSDTVAAPDNEVQVSTGDGVGAGNSSTGSGGGSGGGPVGNESAGNDNVVIADGGDVVGNEIVGEGDVIAEEPRRDCRRVDGRAIVCVPPFTRTPVRGVCVDGRARPVRCPADTPIRDAPRETEPQQSPITRR